MTNEITPRNAARQSAARGGIAVLICDACEVGIENGDWSQLDYYAQTQEEADQDQAQREARLEELSPMVSLGRAPDTATGCFRCACCGEDALGPGAYYSAQGRR